MRTRPLIRLSLSLLILPAALLLTGTTPATASAQGRRARAAAAPAEPVPAYRDPALPIQRRVDDLLARMTVEEKVAQLRCIISEPEAWEEYLAMGLGGVGCFLRAYSPRASAEVMNAVQRRFVEETRLGIPVLMHDEALHGIVGQGGTSFPQSIGLASTWDTGLMEEVAAAIGRETRSRGIRQVLSPTINISRDVRWGRVEETYGEDPWLTARMGVAFCSSIESAGVITTPKHFVANIGDGGRDSNPVHFSERLLHEIYFPAFRACFQEAGAQSVMAAYNSYDGTPCSSSRYLLTEILRREWGFQGFVVSDYGSVGGILSMHHTAADPEETAKQALEAGLDVELPSIYIYGDPLLTAVRAGMIAGSVLDTAVRRVLAAKFRLGLFEDPWVDPAEAERLNDSAAHRELARRAAREAIVLLKNEGHVLPLPKDLETLAVIGPLADQVRLGGYSGSGMELVSVLDGLRALPGHRIAIRFERGCSLDQAGFPAIPSSCLSPGPEFAGRRGLKAEYFNNQELAGEPVLVRVDEEVSFDWGGGSPDESVRADHFSVRWTGTLTPPVTGEYELSITTDDGFRFFLDGRPVAEFWSDRAPGTNFVTLQLEAGRAHAVRLEYYENGGGAVAALGWRIEGQVNEALGRAVETARTSDAAILVLGVNEGEGRDRAELDLPAQEEELIRAVAATGTPTVVVLMTGSAVTMGGWLEEVPAVIEAWYAGEEGGTAVAEVLFGDFNPAGRLPITWPRSVAQLPLYYNHKPTGRGYDYVDLPGTPLYPFGYGLSYTTFSYANLRVTPDGILPGGSAEVSVEVTNSGGAAGDEVVQLYLHDPVASVARPVQELRGFERIALEPGETRRVTFTLTPAHLAFPDRNLEWIVEPGEIEIMVGASSQDIRLRGTLTVRDH